MNIINAQRLAALLIAVFALLFCGSNARSQNGENTQSRDSENDILKTLNFQKGKITLGNNLATLNLTERFVFLNPQDSETFLTKIWSNPPGAGSGALGMILPNPSEISPLTSQSWGVIVGYDDDGYVSDEDAAKIDYDQLLRDMQESTRKRSEELVAQGYPARELVGWARPPYYDSKEKKLYWALRLRFDGNQIDTLNYRIRILGRHGFLSLNVVDSIDGLEKINDKTPTLLNMISFNSGNLYSEFNPSVDKVAAYGLAGLITGGILTKVGFFKGLWLLVLGFKKVIAVGFIAVFGALWTRIKSLFQKKSDPPPP
jgi:uncharacterized membrane-anchored protein